MTVSDPWTPGPADGVAIHHPPLTYRRAGEIASGGSRRYLHAWLELGDLLAGRPGWSCHVGPQVPAIDTRQHAWWQLGAFGVPVIVVTCEPPDGRFLCYDSWNPERGHLWADTVEEVDRWLTSLSPWPGNRERQAAMVDSTDLGADLRRNPSKITERVWAVHVTHRGGVFFAEVPDLPEPPAMADTLPAVLHAAGDLIVATMGGRPEHAEWLRFDVHLDPWAAHALHEQQTHQQPSEGSQ